MNKLLKIAQKDRDALRLGFGGADIAETFIAQQVYYTPQRKGD